MRHVKSTCVYTKTALLFNGIHGWWIIPLKHPGYVSIGKEMARKLWGGRPTPGWKKVVNSWISLLSCTHGGFSFPVMLVFRGGRCSAFFVGGRKGVATVYLEVKRLVNSPSLMGCFMFVFAVKTYQFLVALETFQSLKLAVEVLISQQSAGLVLPTLLFIGVTNFHSEKRQNTLLCQEFHTGFFWFKTHVLNDFWWLSEWWFFFD